MSGFESGTGVEPNTFGIGAAEQTDQSLKAAVPDLLLRLPQSLMISTRVCQNHQCYSICGTFHHNFTGFSICLDVAIMFVRLQIVFIWNGIYIQPTCGSTPVRHRNVILMYLSKDLSWHCKNDGKNDVCTYFLFYPAAQKSHLCVGYVFLFSSISVSL